MTKVRVHIASMQGSWETELLPLELARAYGTEQKKKQPLHYVTLRGFEDGHWEEIPKPATKKKGTRAMAFRKISTDFEAWAAPQEGKTLVGKKVGEKTIPSNRPNQADRVLIIVELVKPYDCTPTDSDDDEPELKPYEPGSVVAITANYALQEFLKYETVTFAVRWKGKKKLGMNSVWQAELAVDDDAPMILKRVNKTIVKTEPVGSGGSDDDIPF